MTHIQLIDKDDVTDNDKIYKEQYDEVEKILDKLVIGRPRIGRGNEESYRLSNGIAIMIDYTSGESKGIKGDYYWHGVNKYKFESYLKKYEDKLYIVLKDKDIGIFPIPGIVFNDLFRNHNTDTTGQWHFHIGHKEERFFIKELEIDISEYRNKVNILYQQKTSKCFFDGRKCDNFKVIDKCAKCLHLNGDLRLDCMFD